MKDVRFAFRQLINNPGFTIVAVLTLALGIGANTALFSVVNALLLRTLPFPEADRLVLVWGQKPKQGQPKLPFSWPNFADVRAQSRSFESLGTWALSRGNLTGNEDPKLVQLAIVDTAFFATMAVKPLVGRTFLPSEDQPGAARVAILSYGLWEQRFGADRSLVGRSVTLDGQTYQLVGVMPAAFNFLSFPKETEVWLPFGADPFTDRRFARAVNSLGVIGRLRTGVTLSQAQAEVDGIASRLAAEYPDDQGWGIKLVGLKDQVVHNYRLGLLVLLTAVGFILLIACANVANLLLARSTVRQQEMAIRTALGASRGRLVLQLCIENLVLACLGGGLGLLLALWGTGLAGLFPFGTPDFFTPYNLPRNQIRVDHQVLLFTAVLSLLTALVFGLAPSLRATRTDLTHGIRASQPFRSGRDRKVDARSFLVVAEIALALVLLIGAGLLIQSLVRLEATSPGFRASNLLTANIALSRTSYSEPGQIALFYQRLVDRVLTLPGVKSAAVVDYVPLSGIDRSSVFLIEGAPEPGPGDERRTHDLDISPGYFRTMGIPLVKGREFDSRDSPAGPRVAIINETMARRYWPKENPVGKRVALVSEALRFRPDGPPETDIRLGLREIVGVVADVKHSKLEEAPVPEMFLPYAQHPVPDMTLVMRTDIDPSGLIGAVKEQVRALDKDQPVSGITTMSQLLTDSVAQPRFNSVVLGVFAGLALVLSVAGIYGVMSYAMTRRTREWGIRIALGAQRSQLLGAALRQGMLLAGIGIAFGMVGAWALTRLLENLLYEVKPFDPLTFAAVPILLALVVLAACWLPARRAARVDPLEALRYE